MIDGFWLPAKDGDPRVFALMRRHYSFHLYTDGRRQRLGYRNRNLVVGPGEKMVLLTVNCDALFVWRKFKDKSGQKGINCAVFRNESPILSSLLIAEAEQLAWQRWPGERLYTYVNPRKIRSSNPGYCFKCAGWRQCGLTKSGLVVLEKREGIVVKRYIVYHRYGQSTILAVSFEEAWRIAGEYYEGVVQIVLQDTYVDIGKGDVE